MLIFRVRTSDTTLYLYISCIIVLFYTIYCFWLLLQYLVYIVDIDSVTRLWITTHHDLMNLRLKAQDRLL